MVNNLFTPDVSHILISFFAMSVAAAVDFAIPCPENGEQNHSQNYRVTLLENGVNFKVRTYTVICITVRYSICGVA